MLQGNGDFVEKSKVWKEKCFICTNENGVYKAWKIWIVPLSFIYLFLYIIKKIIFREKTIFYDKFVRIETKGG